MREVFEEKLVTLPEAREILRRRAEEGEISELQSRALSYLESFSKCDPENSRKLVEELQEMSIPEEYAVIIANIRPLTEDELRTLLAGSAKTYTEEELHNILEKIRKYCSGE